VDLRVSPETIHCNYPDHHDISEKQKALQILNLRQSENRDNMTMLSDRKYKYLLI
jgi:hypothetical protein